MHEEVQKRCFSNVVITQQTSTAIAEQATPERDVANAFATRVRDAFCVTLPRRSRRFLRHALRSRRFLRHAAAFATHFASRSGSVRDALPRTGGGVTRHAFSPSQVSTGLPCGVARHGRQGLSRLAGQPWSVCRLHCRTTKMQRAMPLRWSGSVSVGQI